MPKALPAGEVPSPWMCSDQASAVRESRTRRLTWRGLETGPRWHGDPLSPSQERDWQPSTYRRRACPRPYRREGRAARPFSIPAAEPQRCYDFPCQELPAAFLRSSYCFSPQCSGRGGARTRRRLSLLRSVGWLPPSLPPSGACLCLGSSVLDKPLNAAEGYTKPGLRLF